MIGEIFGMDAMIVVIVLVVLLFGGAAIPKLARNLGSAKNEFEKGQETSKRDAQGAAPESLPASVSPTQTPTTGN